MSELKEALDSIETIIRELNAQLELPENFLMFSENKDRSYSLYMIEPVSQKFSKVILNVAEKGRKGKKYLSIAVKKSKMKNTDIPFGSELKTIPSDEMNSYLIFTEITDSILNFIRDLITDYVKAFEPSEKFGCCHRYKECSDAKKCTHPDQFYSKACWYRKNLENGKIFY